MTDRPGMRHVLARVQDAQVLLLTVHAAAVWVLLGLSTTVQRVVYPAFAHVGPTSAWAAAHALHLRRISQVVALPWLVQGVTTAALLLLSRPAGVPLWLVGLTAVLAAATVGLTVLGAVPAHDRLASYDEQTLARLLRASAWRTAAWAGGSVCAATMLVLAS